MGNLEVTAKIMDWIRRAERHLEAAERALLRNDVHATAREMIQVSISGLILATRDAVDFEIVNPRMSRLSRHGNNVAREFGLFDMF